jgi:UDP-N-acetylmuramate dehydrogenase
MKKHTTYHIGGTVDYYIMPENDTALMCILDILHEENVPYYVLGRGSNLLFEDAHYPGAVINLDRSFNEVYFEENGVMVAQAGCSIIHLAAEAASHSLSGLEFAFGIPGSLGGGLYMNAGAYKSDLASILTEVCVLKDNEICWMPKESLEYGYRSSIFQKHKDWTILAGRFQLQKEDPGKILSLMENRRERRMNSQPLDMPCAGSVFRNPEQKAAWQIIDELGFRGYQLGGARVSDKHSNFIVNQNGQATCADVIELIEIIQKKAREVFGIDLILEVEHLKW